MFPDFGHKIKTKTYIKKLRHGSLRMGIKNDQTKFTLSMCYGYLEIHVQENIIKNYFFGSFHLDIPLIPVSNKIPLVSSDSLGPQLSCDVL